MPEGSLALARELEPRLVDIRRDIHRCPELAFEEERTAALVEGVLREAGLEVTTGVAGTGVVGRWRGREGRTLALRADMDALPLQEANDTPYASRHPGVMHACGHDAHVAMLLGAALLWRETGAGIAGNLTFIFQPAEEKPPGGARGMVEAGVLDDPPAEGIVALHVDPFLPTGSLAFLAGPIMAASDRFTVRILGEGGHAAAPHHAVDAVVVAAHAVLALQSVVSRQVNPLEPAVLSIGAIHGGEGFNVLAGEVTLTGTARTLHPDLRQAMPEKVRGILDGITRAYGGSYVLDWEWGYPNLANHPGLTGLARKAAEELVGSHHCLALKPSMGGEDFAFYAQKVPATYIHLGARRGNVEKVYPWHHPHFDIDEGCLAVGAAFLVHFARRFLEVREP